MKLLTVLAIFAFSSHSAANNAFNVEVNLRDALSQSAQFKDVTDPGSKIHQAIAGFNTKRDQDLENAAQKAGAEGLSVRSLTWVAIKTYNRITSPGGFTTSDCRLANVYVEASVLNVFVLCDSQRTFYDKGVVEFSRHAMEKHFTFTLDKDHKITSYTVNNLNDLGTFQATVKTGIREAVNLLSGLPNKSNFFDPANAEYLKRFPKYAPYVEPALDYNRKINDLFHQEMVDHFGL